MYNKKATHGFQWDALWISLVVGVIIYTVYSPAYASVPEPGKFSIGLSKSFENNNEKITIEGVVSELIKRTKTEIIDKGIVTKKDCGNYLDSPLMNDGSFNSCVDEDFNIKEDFENIFSQKFEKIKPKILEIDLSKINYEISVDKIGGNFLINGLTNDKLNIPLIIKKGEKEKNSGTRQPKPSFSKNIGYDLDEYGLLIDSIKNIINNCKNAIYMQECAKNNIHEIFKIIENCETKEKQSFFDFVEYFDRCSNSKDTSCICSAINPSWKGSFEISQDGENIIIKDKGNAKNTYLLKNKLLVNPNYVFVEGESHIHKDHKGKIIVSVYWDSDNCNVEQKTKYKFCVKGKNEVFAYDEDDKKAMKRSVIYKFALDFGRLEQKQKKLETLSKKIIVVNAECTNPEDKILELTSELEGNFEDISTTISFNTCDIKEEEKITTLNSLIKLQSDIGSIFLITLSSGNENIIYNDGNILVDSIIKEINGDFIKGTTTLLETKTTNPETINSIKISFKNLELENDEKTLEYANAISLGIKNYVETEDKPEEQP